MTDFEPEDQPMPALSRLKALAAEKTSARGLILRGFLIDPNLDPNGPTHVQVVTSLDVDWKPDAEPESDSEFDRVIKEAEMAEQADKADKARKSLADLRDTLTDRNKGLGLDD